jgi:YNFM family putative membrane transporter
MSDASVSAITLATPLVAILAGLTLLSSGIFGAHTILSGWVGARADGATAQASSLYLLAYYVGSSAAGSLGGRVWEDFAWPGTAACVCLLVGTAPVVAMCLWHKPA